MFCKVLFTSFDKIDWIYATCTWFLKLNNALVGLFFGFDLGFEPVGLVNVPVKYAKAAKCNAVVIRRIIEAQIDRS